MRTLKNIHIPEMNQKFQLDLHETNDDHLVDLNELFVHFELNPEISKIDGVAERFWNQVVIHGLNGASFYPKKSTLAIQQLLKLPEADQSRNNANIQEPFTLDGEHHLNYKAMLDLDESKIPTAQVLLLKKAIQKNAKLVETMLDEIVTFIKSISNEYNGFEIISEPRREYYLKSFITRFEDVLKVKNSNL